MICLLPHCAYLSETTRMIEIHRALADRDVVARVLTHGGAHESLLAEAGIAYERIGPGLSEARSAAFVRSAVGLGPPTQSMYTDDEIRAYALAEADYFRRHHIRVAVTGFTLTALLSTRLAGVRLVTEHAGSFVPPVIERGLVPPGPQGPVAPATTLAYCGGFNRVAEALRVPAVPSLAALLLGDLTLVPEVPQVLGIGAEELAAWTPVGSGYRPETRLAYAGPLFARLDRPVPARVERFLDAAGPVVYVAMTSTGPDLVRATVRALRPLSVRILVAGTVHDLSDLADHQVLVEQVLPSHRIMPRVELAVVTGGQGSVQTAMAAGTPVLGVPLHSEQALNVALVERLGAARALPHPAVEATQVLRTAGEILADGRSRGCAERVRDWYDQVDGPARAAELLLHAADGG